MNKSRAIAAAFFLTVAPFSFTTIGAEPLVFDDFEAAEVDKSTWWLGQIRPTHLKLETRVARSGSKALAIRVKGEDRDCGGRCQRNEIRIANPLRLTFGDEAWYGFSFRIDGEIQKRGSTRWIIGQWKQETGGSPFLAQRYDNGIFHITVQDNDCRIIIAHAGGHADNRREHEPNLGYSTLSFLSDSQYYDCESDIHIEHGGELPVLPDPYNHWVDMLYRVRGGRQGQGLIEVWANGDFIARVRGSIGYDNVSGPTQYFKIGHYRDLMPAATTLYLDNFRRGDARDVVERLR